MKTRRLFLIGDIDSTLYDTFTKQLRKCEQDKVERVIIELTSEGGDPYTSLAFYSRIRESSCQIHVLARGYVASAAVLILAAGDYRLMSAETWVMVHEETEQLECEVHEAERAVKQMRKLEDQADRLLESRTTMDSDWWKQAHKETTYFDSTDCMEIGLIEEIVNEKKS